MAQIKINYFDCLDQKIDLTAVECRVEHDFNEIHLKDKLHKQNFNNNENIISIYRVISSLPEKSIKIQIQAAVFKRWKTVAAKILFVNNQ